MLLFHRPSPPTKESNMPIVIYESTYQLFPNREPTSTSELTRPLTPTTEDPRALFSGLPGRWDLYWRNNCGPDDENCCENCCAYHYGIRISSLSEEFRLVGGRFDVLDGDDEIVRSTTLSTHIPQEISESAILDAGYYKFQLVLEVDLPESLVKAVELMPSGLSNTRACVRSFIRERTISDGGSQGTLI